MDFRLKLTPPTAPHTFAEVALTGPDGRKRGQFRVTGEPLADLGPSLPEEALDLFLLAATVYALDRHRGRGGAPDAWTRSFELELPVRDPARWAALQPRVDECLSFLTGDQWAVTFTRRTVELLQRKPIAEFGQPPPEAASLFSGGLDSLIGVINHLEAHPTERLLLVGHHDRNMPGPKKDQDTTLRHIRKHYPGRTSEVLMEVGIDPGYDTTLRGRSILFIGIGICAASALATAAPLLVPENGTVALNVPLTPSRFGTCSTRTAHPHYLDLLAEIVSGLGFGNSITNPLMDRTKGECIVTCAKPAVLRDAYRGSPSCAKRGHRSTWVRRDANQCGRCMPCIYRRAALHKAGLDNERYGRDICAGEVDPGSVVGYADDFRAFISFLSRNLDPEGIARLLVANGGLGGARALGYGRLVARAMEEVRQLLRDKGTAEIQRKAGLFRAV